MELVFKSKNAVFKNVAKIKLYYVGEKHPTILTPKKFKVVKRFPSSVFNFKPPKNTEIENMK